MKLTRFKATMYAFTVLLCMVASPVLAGWGSVGGSSGGYSYGSSGGVAYYGSYGSAVRPFTPIRSALRGIGNHIAGKFHRHQAWRAGYSGYGSSGYAVGYGSSGGHGSSGGYSTSYGSSGGYSTSYGSTGGVSYGSSGSYGVSYGAVESYGSTGGVSYGSTGGTIYHGASHEISSEPGLELASSVSGDDAVYLSVNVPSAAKVFVNDKPTSSTGSVRQFVSRGLAAGKSYKFDVRAELTLADGQVVQEEKTIVVSAGDQQQMEFAFSDAPAKIQTSLTLNVPEGATVILAGNATKATGNQRVYQSSHLKLGESWDDYQIEVQHNGQVKRQAIRLIGGDELALTFDFEDQPGQLAAK